MVQYCGMASYVVVIVEQDLGSSLTAGFISSVYNGIEGIG